MKMKRYTKLMALRVSEDTKAKIKEMAKEMNMADGELIRDALQRYLKKKAKELGHNSGDEPLEHTEEHLNESDVGDEGER